MPSAAYRAVTRAERTTILHPVAYSGARGGRWTAA